MVGHDRGPLEADFDKGLPGITIVGADGDGYCLSTAVAERTWYAAGPPLAVSQTSCA